MRNRRLRGRARMLALGLLLGAARAWAAADVKLEPVTVRPGDTLWSISQKYLKDPTSWSEILKYNKLPTSDPTVALPGMTLKIPTTLIKERFRAATLTEAVREVFAREEGKPAWADVKKGRLLYHGDGLRTRKQSWARVQFSEGGLLSVEPDSMVILKAPQKDDHDLFLNRGAVQATRARVQTQSARVIPRGGDTKYTARVKNDLSTEVKVFQGEADVEDIKGLKKVVVKAGHATNIALDGLPQVPVRIPDMNLDMDANSAITLGRGPSEVRVAPGTVVGGNTGIGDAEQLAVDLQKLSIGMPVAAYHVQIARTRKFSDLLYDKQIDAYGKLDLAHAGLPSGSYWARVAIIDLLGDRGRFSEPRPYRVGSVAREEAVEKDERKFEVVRPAEEVTTVSTRRFRIRGKADPGLTVQINGKDVPKDEDGNFSLQVELNKGSNEFKVSAADLRGNERLIRRTINYRE